MSLEIERRWLPKDDTWKELIKTAEFVDITQGYLAIDDNVNVYVRITNSKSRVKSTLRVRIRRKNAEVMEHKTLLTYTVGQAFLDHCNRVLVKRRWYVMIDSIRYSIDEFRGQLEGLVIIELELGHTNTIVRSPPWVGTEVTGSHYYNNSHLVQYGMPDDTNYGEAP